MDAVIAHLVANAPIAGVVLAIFLLQRKDYREDQATQNAALKSERDARDRDTKANMDRVNGWLDKFMGAMKGDER